LGSFRIETQIRLDMTAMRKINTKDIPEELFSSPKGKYGGADKDISIALGRKPSSTDLKERHPFDVESAGFHRAKASVPITHIARSGNSTMSFPGMGWSGIRTVRPKSNLAMHSFSSLASRTRLPIMVQRNFSF
jgi:hypothetical protein